MAGDRFGAVQVLNLELEINAKAGRLAQAAQTSIQLETAERR